MQRSVITNAAVPFHPTAPSGDPQPSTSTSPVAPLLAIGAVFGAFALLLRRRAGDHDSCNAVHRGGPFEPGATYVTVSDGFEDVALEVADRKAARSLSRALRKKLTNGDDNGWNSVETINGIEGEKRCPISSLTVSDRYAYMTPSEINDEVDRLSPEDLRRRLGLQPPPSPRSDEQFVDDELDT